MGHDLKARIPGTKNVVAHLRISGRRRRETRIYDALKVPQFNAQDSGTGDVAVFDAKALKPVKGSIFLTHDERTFLQQCYDQSKAQGIEIEFA